MPVFRANRKYVIIHRSCLFFSFFSPAHGFGDMLCHLLCTPLLHVAFLIRKIPVNRFLATLPQRVRDC